MAWTIPTIQNIISGFLSSIEGWLGQSTPLGNKAYNRVISGAQGMAVGGLYRYATDRGKAVLAQTAQGSDLDAIAAGYPIPPRGQGTAAVFQINLPAADGTTVNAATTLNGPNGLQYQTLSTVTAPWDAITGHGVTVLVSCLVSGSQGNLGLGAALTLLQPIAGTTPPATIVSLSATGCVTAVDPETDPPFAQRILAIQRAYGGGGNAADYRTWASAVSGVANAYPYAGLPYYGQLSGANAYAAQAVSIFGSPTGGTFTLTYNGQTSVALNYNVTAAQLQTALQALTGASAVLVSTLSSGALLVTGFGAFAPLTLGTNSLTGGTSPTVLITPNSPPARTVYVESLADAGGVANPTLIAAVVQGIKYGANALSNQPLGLTMDSLYVQPILRTNFYVQLTSLVCNASQVATVQAAVLTAVQAFFTALFPFVDGVDPVFTRNDLVTQTNLSGAVQAVLTAYGASVAGVGFGTAAGAFISTYQLGQGEKAQLAGGGLSWI